MYFSIGGSWSVECLVVVFENFVRKIGKAIKDPPETVHVHAPAGKDPEDTYSQNAALATKR
jgi:hypothetical protein